MQRVGKYQLLRKIATGGMAEVFLARAEGPMGFQKRLVVKRILPHFSQDPNFVGMFLGEAKLAAELNHPNLVQIFDFGEADGQYYLAMEYIDGPNLRVLNNQARALGTPLPLSLSARLMSSAAEGLHAAHELRDEQGQLVNLVHRDISPDNILVARNGSVKVVDFGIAKVSSEPSKTKPGIIKGKLAYMPPEQLAREPLDRRSDIFALGVVLFELVAGTMPFDATSEVSIIQAIMSTEPLERARSRRPEVPLELDAIIAKCLEKAPGARYASCKELQSALEHFIASNGTAVFASDVAHAVNELVPPVAEPSYVSPSGNVIEAMGEKTVSSPRVISESSDERSDEPMVPTHVHQSTPRPATGPGPRKDAPPAASRSRPQLVPIALVLMAMGFIGGALFVFRPWATSAVPPVIVPMPVRAEPLALGVKAHLEPVAEDPKPVPVTVTEPAAASAKTGKLELRIRPFASVFVDGKPMGQTPPLPPLTLSVGKHRLKLVNEELHKTVEQDIVIRAGEPAVFKLNFKE